MKIKRGGIATWVEWTVTRKKIVYLLVAVVVAVGIFGTSRIAKDEFPSFEITQGLVAGIYPGADAAEVEERLAKPIEEILFSFKEVDRKSAKTVSKDGVCYIYIDLLSHKNVKDEVWSKIKLALQQRKATLPGGVLAVVVLDEFANTSALLVAIESEDQEYTALKAYSEELTHALRRIPELSAVSVIGGREEEIAVTVDGNALSSYGISPSTLLAQYQVSTITSPDGSFAHNGFRIPVRVSNTVSSEQEILDKIIYSDPAGNIVRMRDVATVERRYEDPSGYVTYNGRQCVMLSVEMRTGNDIVAFGREVDKVLESYRRSLPPSVHVIKVTDQPKVVGDSVSSFLRDLLISMLVVVLVMLLLFPLRSALIASSGLPIITAMSLAVMYLTKMELNTVTLAGLIVVLGMIVDDSIITMDGYMDKLGKGLPRLKAASSSAQELFMPTFTATLAISLMFFPVPHILTGYLSDFVRLFPWVVFISLMLSLVYAVSVVPALETRFILTPHRGKTTIITRFQDRLFRLIQNVYEWAQMHCFRHTGITIAIGIAVVAAGGFLFTRLNIQMVPKAARDYFVVEVEMDASSSLERTRHLTDSLEKILLADKRVTGVTSFVGVAAPRFSAVYTPKLPSPGMAQVIVQTTSNAATESMIKQYEATYETMFPEALVRFKQMDYQAVDAPVIVSFKGAPREQLLEYASEVKAFLSKDNTRTKWVHGDSDNFVTSARVGFDPDEASRLGVLAPVVSLQMYGILEGATVATLWEGAYEVPVRLKFRQEESISDIGNTMVPTGIPGVDVPLRQVSTITPETSIAELTRLGGENAVSVYSDLRFGQGQPPVSKDLRAFVDGMDLPEGVTVTYGGLDSLNNILGPEIALAFAVAVLILFGFLVLHFRKISIAVLTILMSTLCFFGAFLGLWVFNLDFGITAALGLISLIGIIVRNGILLYEYAEDRVAEGMDVRTAAIEAGKRRVRPIFLTSCTTALGVLPMVIRGDFLWQPMGVIICFGTLLSIMFTTLIMPVSYYLAFKNRKSDEKETV